MRAGADRAMSWSMRCYRGMLRAYPRPFLAEFEDLLCQAFADLAHRAVRTKGFWGLFVLWMRTVPDLISSALSQRFRPDSDLRFRLRWILACTAGVVLGAACVIGPVRIFNELRMWFVVVPSHPAPFVPVLPKPDPVFVVNYGILRDVALMGLVVGLFQSLALELKRFQRFAWTFATALGSTLAAGAVLMVPFIPTYLRVTIHPWRLFVDHHQAAYYGGCAIVCASLVGILQILAMSHRNSRVMVWIPASTVGILACSFVVVVSAPLINRIYWGSHHSSIVVYTILGVFAGVVYGLLTVLPLEWIFQPAGTREVAPESSQKLPS